jgi:uncharacterized protein (TIGR00369 family)
MLQMDIQGLQAFLAREFPQVSEDVRIDGLDVDRLTMRLLASDRHLRPGGTVGGPAIFMLADVATYCVILSRIGPLALTVTTNAGIDFFRKPAADRDLLCEATILKLGRSLVVADTRIFSEGSGLLVARANLTYSIPPAPRQHRQRYLNTT